MNSLTPTSLTHKFESIQSQTFLRAKDDKKLHRISGAILNKPILQTTPQSKAIQIIQSFSQSAHQVLQKSTFRILSFVKSFFKETKASDFSPGDFSFLKDWLCRKNLEEAYKVANETPGVWDALKTMPDPCKGGILAFCLKKPVLVSFMDQINDISNHSGLSMSWTMGSLGIIAREGWERFVESHLLLRAQ